MKNENKYQIEDFFFKKNDKKLHSFRKIFMTLKYPANFFELEWFDWFQHALNLRVGHAELSSVHLQRGAL